MRRWGRAHKCHSLVSCQLVIVIGVANLFEILKWQAKLSPNIKRFFTFPGKRYLNKAVKLEFIGSPIKRSKIEYKEIILLLL